MSVQEVPFSMWKNKNYVRLFTAQVISLIGTGISSVCLPLLAYSLADNNAGLVLGVAFALKMVAYILLAPVFGALASRLPKQSSLVFLDFARAAVFVLIPFVTEVWQVLVLVFIVSACSAGFTPLYQSVLPTVLRDKEQYVKALSFSRLAYDLEQIVSPIATAILLGFVSFNLLFFIDALTFVVSGILLMCCSLPLLTAKSFASQKMSIKVVCGNLFAYLRIPSLRSLWFAYLAAASASAMVLVNTVVYVQERLLGEEQLTALALSIVGFGSMVVALLMPRLVKRIPICWFHYAGMLSLILALSAGYLLPGWLGFAIICMVLGAGASAIQTTAGIVITEASGEEDASPYFAAHFSLTHFWWFITYLLAGTSVTWLGLANGYLIMGGICLVSLSLYFFEKIKSDLNVRNIKLQP